MRWDRETFLFLNNLGNETFDPFWSAVTNFSTWTPLFILLFVLILKAYPWKEAVSILLTLIILLFCMLWLTDWIKEATARLRPNNDEEIKNMVRILKNPGSYSFFSGHASSSFTITMFLFLFLRDRFKVVWPLFIWPTVFAFSRVYVGVHFPLDIIFGAFAGVSAGTLFYLLFKKVIQPYTGSDRPV